MTSTRKGSSNEITAKIMRRLSTLKANLPLLKKLDQCDIALNHLTVEEMRVEDKLALCTKIESLRIAIQSGTSWDDRDSELEALAMQIAWAKGKNRFNQMESIEHLSLLAAELSLTLHFFAKDVKKAANHKESLPHLALRGKNRPG